MQSSLLGAFRSLCHYRYIKLIYYIYSLEECPPIWKSILFPDLALRQFFKCPLIIERIERYAFFISFLNINSVKILRNRNFKSQNDVLGPLGDMSGSSGVPGVKSRRSDGPLWSQIGVKGDPSFSTFRTFDQQFTWFEPIYVFHQFLSHFR